MLSPRAWAGGAIAIAGVVFGVSLTRGGAETEPAASEPARHRGVLLLATASETDHGLVARVERLRFAGAAITSESFDDTASSVFHVARCDPSTPGAILTAAGMGASVERWQRDGANGWRATDLWRPTFGRFSSRVRDAELVDGSQLGRRPGPTLVVGTHDQGVVALVPLDGGGAVEELGRAEATLVHEIEVGDVDGDGVLEIWATESPPNSMLPEAEQPGRVVRYVPARGEGREVVADFSPRHAKEILVTDLDGDGRDELYAVVEARTDAHDGHAIVREPVEIRRVAPDGTTELVASIDDRLTRFLVSADLDGDHHRELVAASFTTGVHWLRPDGPTFRDTPIDTRSGGYEHAIVAADLDADGRDELYEADDPAGELRRYTWTGEGFRREVIEHDAPHGRITWSLSVCSDGANDVVPTTTEE